MLTVPRYQVQDMYCLRYHAAIPESASKGRHLTGNSNILIPEISSGMCVFGI